MPYGTADPSWNRVVRCSTCSGIRDVNASCPFCHAQVDSAIIAPQRDITSYTAGVNVDPLNSIFIRSNYQHAVAWLYRCSHKELEFRCWNDTSILFAMCSAVQLLSFSSEAWHPNIVVSCHESKADRRWLIKDTGHEFVINCKKLVVSVFENC